MATGNAPAPPSNAPTGTPETDSLAKTLLRHLGLPEGTGLETSPSETKVTKDCEEESGVDGDDAVK